MVPIFSAAHEESTSMSNSPHHRHLSVDAPRNLGVPLEAISLTRRDVAQPRPNQHSEVKTMPPTSQNPCFVQDNLQAVRRVLLRLSPLLPPQIPEHEIVGNLVLGLTDGSVNQLPGDTLDDRLWNCALAYLRAHPLVQAASKWLALDPEDDSPEALREAALALTVFADRWLPSETRQDQELLARAMSRLGTYERLIMALFFYDGLSVPEIAQALDLPPDEVASLYLAAIRQLRTNLAHLSLEATAEF
jgi:hypothetical protein